MPPVGGPGGGRPPARRYVIPTTGPVTAREVYALLIQKGLSSNQAIGVLANMWAESHIDPESDGVDSNGYRSVGAINWNTKGYTNAGQLVTGDPQKDIRAQIDYLFTSTSGLSAGLQGATAADVAGNFADHVEVCQGCATGDTTTPNGWGARRGYATMIQGWASSGRWPKSAGSAQGGPAGSGGPGAGGGKCILSLPLVGCVLSTSSARGVIGGGMILAAVPIGLVGAVVLVALGFRRSGAGPAIARSAEAAGGAVAFVPGLEGAGAAVAAAGSAERRRARGREQRAQARHDEAEYKRARARGSRASSTRRPPPELDPAPF